MTPANRVEITLSDDRLAALDAARGFEPRASFIKRVLEQALSDSPTGGDDDKLRRTVVSRSMRRRFS